MFRFSLETALNVRKKQEKLKMKELAEKLAIQQNVLSRIDQINLRIDQAEEALNSKKAQRIFTIDQMKHMTHFKEKMRVDLGHCGRELILADKEVEEKQKALIEASRARKTLEILREKEEKKYLEKITRNERIFMDEIAGSLFCRNKIHSAS